MGQKTKAKKVIICLLKRIKFFFYFLKSITNTYKHVQYDYCMVCFLKKGDAYRTRMYYWKLRTYTHTHIHIRIHIYIYLLLIKVIKKE